jgi:hypothetical protein
MPQSSGSPDARLIRKPAYGFVASCVGRRRAIVGGRTASLARRGISGIVPEDVTAVPDAEVVIVGAGPCVAAALALKDVGVRSVVLDRADDVASAWRGRHDRLRLNTSWPGDSLELA